MKKSKIILAAVIILFLGFLYFQLNNFTKIPDHIHSIDDKQPEQRTDEENITVLERTLQKEPNNISIMLQLSELYLKTGQKSEAAEMLEKILEIEPSNKKPRN
jgi:cytochrome c-type biogenesis protein CcmH/NrfG